jgi:hypothetical protein
MLSSWGSKFSARSAGEKVKVAGKDNYNQW